MIFAGIGSRETPANILDYMFDIALQLAAQGVVLRSGKADGADLAFQHGYLAYADNKGACRAEILLPWYNWQSSVDDRWDILVEDDDIVHRAMQICSKVHPAWNKLKRSHKLMHTRNMFQILGPKLDADELADFVIFWAPEFNDRVEGGTASAVNLARKFSVPNFNMFTHGPKALVRFLRDLDLDYYPVKTDVFKDYRRYRA